MRTPLPRQLVRFSTIKSDGSRCEFLRLGLPHPSQELLDRLRDRVSELQAERTDLEPLRQDRGLTEAWEAREAAPTGVLGPRSSIFQVLRGIRSPKTMRDSGCFGRRLDRIGSLSGLGCNGEHPPPFPLHAPVSITSGFDVSGDQTPRKGHLDITLSCCQSSRPRSAFLEKLNLDSIH